jgi:hypothetical protein
MINPFVNGCGITVLIDGTNHLTCSFPSLASGTPNDITINVQATATQADCPNSLSNSAHVTADNDTTPANNTSGPVIILPCQ